MDSRFPRPACHTSWMLSRITPGSRQMKMPGGMMFWSTGAHRDMPIFLISHGEAHRARICATRFFCPF